jgi:hypothetical protein
MLITCSQRASVWSGAEVGSSRSGFGSVVQDMIGSGFAATEVRPHIGACIDGELVHGGAECVPPNIRPRGQSS